MNTRLIRYRQPAACLLLIAVCILLHPSVYADFFRTVPAGPVDFVPLYGTPNNLISARISSREDPDLIITYEIPALSIFNTDRHKVIELDYVVAFIQPVRKTEAEDFIACIPAHKKELHILRYNPREQAFVTHWSKELSNTVFKLGAADVSNNGHDDLLILMKDRTGVGVMQNNGDGTFADIEFIFDDIVVSIFQVADLNGDGINDFILYDPIQNILRFHYGFGSMVFALERYHALPGPVNFFHALPIAEDAIYDLIAMFPDQGEFKTYLGDGLGRFSHIQSRRLSSRTQTFLFTDLFDTDRPDLIVAEHETGLLRLYRNNYHRGYEPAGILQLATGIRDMAILPNKETGRDDIHIIDTENDRLIILGLLPAIQEYLPHKLALASEATDMVSANLFGGELPELYVLGKESGTISVYWYDRLFRLNHSMITLPGNPDNLYVHRGPGERTKLVISDRKSDLVTIVSMHWDRSDMNMYGIPAMAGSDIIHLGSTPDGRFQLGTLAYAADTKIPVLSLFEQIASDEYIERSFEPVPEGDLLALDVVDLTGDKAVDIVYVFREENGKGVYMTSAINDSDYSFRRLGESLALEDSTFTAGFIVSETAPDGRAASFIVYLDGNETGGHLFRIAGDDSGMLSLLSSNAGGKVIQSPKYVFMLRPATVSFNSIVFYNALTERIEIVHSMGDGSFMNPEPLKRVDDLSAFTVYSEPIGEVHMLVIGRKDKPFIEVSRIYE